MITDKMVIFDEAIAVTTSKVGSNVIDLGSIGDVGEGQQVFLNIWLDTAFTSAANGLTISLISSTAEAVGAADNAIEILPATLASAMGTAGQLKKVALPEDIVGNYVNLYYLATTALAAGKISTFLTIG
jgi:hypothetical protein